MKYLSASRLAAWFALNALTGLACAGELYSNGPIVGADGKSVLASPAVTLGFGAQANSNNAVADDFIVDGAGWLIQSIDFFAYQNNATTFTLGDVSWSILSGDVNSGVLIASGTTTLSNGGFVGYRVTPTAPNVSTRQIYRAQADIPDLSLAAGHYWLSWSFTGSLSSGPWQAPTADGRAGNAMQSGAGASFVGIIDNGSKRGVELPFMLHGSLVSAVPEPSVWLLMLAGGLGLAGQRALHARRARHAAV